MNIELEKTSDATQIKCGTVYNYGTLKVGDHEYPFTIAEMVNDNPRWTESEITWAEDTPPDHEKAEEAIMLKFEQLGAPAQEGGQAPTGYAIAPVAETATSPADPSRNPDTRKLRMADHDECCLTFEGPFSPVGRVHNGPDATEMVRRWNAHNAMRDALQSLVNIATHPKATKAQIKMIANEVRAALESTK